MNDIYSDITMDSMYDILLALPLFKGVSRERLSGIIEKNRFHFLKYPAGETIVHAGDLCDHVQFVISGKARVSMADQNDRIRVSQTIVGPEVLVPDFLFGKKTFYPCEITAQETCGILQIQKQDYLNILNSDNIFLFNYLNYISMDAQKGIHGVLAVAGGDLEVRIAFWIIALTQSGGTDIVMSCRQRDLYTVFGVQRTSLIATLDSMKERGIIDYTPNEIRVLSRDALISVIADAMG